MMLNIHTLGSNKAVANVCCPFCGKLSSVKVNNLENLENWAEGEGLVQDMLPDLSAEDREILITGMCKECQQKMFTE